MTPSPPEIRTARLHLRPFTDADAPALTTLLSHPQIAAGMRSIPSPYPPGLALTWIHSRPDAARQGRSFSWAVTDRQGGQLLGSVTLSPDPDQPRAELGYWIGVPHHGRGYATEAARLTLDFGFGPLHLRRLHATVFPWNAASARVLDKLGFQCEGTLRHAAFRDAQPTDLILYSRLNTDPA
ncbi:GNAT family N-acetyltransferase [Deinococcus radiotolerans]|uniref:GNAT family acetyltransferase n=1 Tax=Deinococcus radiotolerans TaxID=1309407 RepID=A0ABQ2FPZ0_9DEIO|nr:GNAT family N-acetyltransferase [Deinococcus radiotolerans]GGL15363.1 GNAT family acetyltransferase [Deinococcus radiotolerans]